MNKTVTLTALMACSMGAHASMTEMQDAELSSVRGQLNLVSVVNAGIFSDSVFSLVSGFGADSLVSGAQILGGRSVLTGATVLASGWLSGVNVAGFAPIGTLFNLGGLATFSGANTLGISAFSGVSLPVGATGASVVTLPWTFNGFGIFNLF
ncbi:MAG: hypothetical protein SVO96_11175 [Pseudomonadota bacterium]|nr:hypothetical protein [Pseudomonadota bacterium]